MYESAVATSLFFNLKTKALHCFPTKFIAGKMMLLRAMISGFHLDICPASSTPLAKISKSYNFLAMTPFQVRSSIKNLHKIKLLIIGGGVISDSLSKNIAQLSADIYQTYGMTETITHIAVKKLDGRSPYFQCLPNISVDTDQEVVWLFQHREYNLIKL